MNVVAASSLKSIDRDAYLEQKILKETEERQKMNSFSICWFEIARNKSIGIVCYKNIRNNKNISFENF